MTSLLHMESMWLPVLVLFLANMRLIVHSYAPDEIDCPENVNNGLYFSSAKIPLGTPNRDFLTTPEGFVIQMSGIPGANNGVFVTSFLPRYTWIGEYEGEIYSVEDEDLMETPEYAWRVLRDEEIVYYVDAYNRTLSNWLRYINCPRHVSEANIMVQMCYGHVLYVTDRDILPGEELFVYYGDDYAVELGIDTDEYYDTEICPSFKTPKGYS